MSQSSEEEIDEFYRTLINSKSQWKSQQISIIMPDLNVKGGNEGNDEISSSEIRNCNAWRKMGLMVYS